MVQEVFFRYRPEGLGIFDQPDPLLARLAGVILLHRGEALVGAWDEDCFIHPRNQRELEPAALAAILASHPDVSPETQTLRVFTCPQVLVDQFDFGLWQSEWLRESGSLRLPGSIAEN